MHIPCVIDRVWPLVMIGDTALRVRRTTRPGKSRLSRARMSRSRATVPREAAALAGRSLSHP